ncbi:polysaccharide deacetylase family protein [Sinomonas humi]|uniref:polysaccharide deacetylase family protein n=1 Tax=Sinomonas humi TaxID=1338436 RepID=UPI00068B1FF6|nr:polysaccharide deacetylase family protein [Sinomonas humi]
MRRSPLFILGMTLVLALANGAGGTALALPSYAAREVPAAALQAAEDPIVQHYQQLGGSASFLGQPFGSTYSIAGGRAQDYAGGTIYWSALTGAFEVHGGIRARYLALGGPGGFLGFPVTDETSTPGGGGRFNDFAGGSVYWSAATGAHEVHGAIRGRYLALGGPSGFLGFPLADETGTPGGGGRFNDFAGGSVYWSAATGAHEVHGAIRGRYLALGGPSGFLGFPLADETATPGAAGRYNDFARGAVYWSAATGAHEVHGAIRGRYLELGGPAGVLGFPQTDETATPDGVGRYNHFSGTIAGSSIYWSPATGAHEVYGAIRAQWASLGWERSRLGYPVSGEYGITGGRRSDFQHGSILWHSASGRTEVIYTAIPSSLLGVDLERIPTSQKVVALTFDAGANDAALRSILNTLAANGVPGTFFLTGDWVNQFPSDPALVYNAGNRIGNHSMTHPDFTTLSDAQIAAEISSAQSTIERAGADPLPFFRFPFGARDSRTIADVNAAGYAAIRWTVDTLGWEGTMNGTRGPSFVVQRVMAAAQPGEIVLMHLGSNPDDGSTLDAAALPDVISQLRAAGYGFVTLDAALG